MEQPAPRWRDDAAAERDLGFQQFLLDGARLLQLGDAPGARGKLEQALRLRPQNEKARNLLGQTYFKMGLLDAAERVFRTLSDEYPREPTLRLNLALVFLKRGGMDKARVELETLYRMHPTHQKALSYLGLVYERLGDLQRARWAFLRAGSARVAGELESKLRQKGLPLEPPSVPQPEPPTSEIEPVPPLPTPVARPPPQPPQPPAAEAPAPDATTAHYPVVDEPTPAEDAPPAMDDGHAEEHTDAVGLSAAVVEAALAASGVERPPAVAPPEPAPPPPPPPPPAPWVRAAVEHPASSPPPARRHAQPEPCTQQTALAALAVLGLAVRAAATRDETLPPPVVETPPPLPALVVETLPPAVVADAAGGPTLIPGAFADLPLTRPAERAPQPPAPPVAQASAALPRLLSAMASETAAPAADQPDAWSGGVPQDSMVLALSGDAMTGDQWLARKSIPAAARPFGPIAPGLLGLRVDGEVLVRARTVAAMEGEVDSAAAQRHPDDGSAPAMLGGQEDPLLACWGNGQLSLDPGELRVAVLKVENSEATVLEGALFGCSSGLSRQDISLTLDDEGPRLPAVRFRGQGVVAVRSASSVRAVACQKGVPLRVSMEHLLAFEGPLTWVAAPAVGGLVHLALPRAAVLEGQGVVLLRAGTRPA
ncbi:MAG: tetratricopeptide repeat protein [Deltaproteobacteria bacterium]|nr:tetratricopeptide repeat protein [Deltaproteobacteria bacterium]